MKWGKKCNAQYATSFFSRSGVRSHRALVLSLSDVMLNETRVPRTVCLRVGDRSILYLLPVPGRVQSNQRHTHLRFLCLNNKSVNVTQPQQQQQQVGFSFKVSLPFVIH
jgi:hypothetical protein